MTQFSWAPFYSKLADKIAEFAPQEKHKDLVLIVRRIFAESGIGKEIPKNGEYELSEEIDPFTFFALINRNLKSESKIALLQVAKRIFNIDADVPNDFDGIPQANHNRIYYAWVSEPTYLEDVNGLWRLFKSALDYSSVDVNREQVLTERFEKNFNDVLKQKGVGCASITMGLFWFRPESFISIDDCNVKFLYKHQKLPAGMREKYVEDGLKAADGKLYLQFCRDIQSAARDGTLGYAGIKELSWAAFLSSSKGKKTNNAAEKESPAACDNKAPVVALGKPNKLDCLRSFLDWFTAFGPRQSYEKYVSALDNPHGVIKFRADNPSQGHVQAADLDLSKFPHEGKSCRELRGREEIKSLFDETRSFRVGDDGALHAALGYYALWLRIVAFECWKDEPFWEGDDTAPGGKSRKATLLSNGFDYDEVYANRKTTHKMDKYLAAIRTKPFVLLAGISGTGKSRLVRQLARGCCPKKDGAGNPHPLCAEQKPGNFEMIPVRPNWHDSSELMGYVSRITGKDEYQVTDFVRFLCQAWRYEQEGIPFFLCLDEMNLAPVEQYFAEYLSVIETRKRSADGKIVTDPLIRFKNEAMLRQVVEEAYANSKLTQKEVDTYIEQFKGSGGIPIPSNLVVMGTVNMDETTCSFSHKVLDRAMSFELNDVSDMYDPAKLADEGDLEFGTIPTGAATPKFLTGKEAYDVDAGMGEKILGVLEILNEQKVDAKNEDGTDDAGKKRFLLAKTPFKIAYRTRNEIMIYCLERCGGGSGGQGLASLPKALDEALSMKVLSRIEGDNLHVPKKWLVTLSATIDKQLSSLPGYDKDACKACREKLAEMADQTDNGYTSFWTR